MEDGFWGAEFAGVEDDSGGVEFGPGRGCAGEARHCGVVRDGLEDGRERGE